MRVSDGNKPLVLADLCVKLSAHKHDEKNTGHNNAHTLPFSLQACPETAQNEAVYHVA